MKKIYFILSILLIQGLWLSQIIAQSPIPSSYSVDKSLDVGEIPFQQSVSPTGIVNITVPIDVYSAPNSFSPSVSLNYNSMAGDGLSGWGWQLSCGSVISRSNKTFYYDGETRSVVPNTKDGPFYLDGQRLIVTASTTIKITYETEVGFIKVYATVSGNNITRFDVSYPNGIKNEYTIQDGINYYLTKSKDVQGHFAEYKYYNGNPKLLNEITYGNDKRAKINISYADDNISYYPKTYKAGILFNYDTRIKNISSRIGDSIYSKYTLEYSERGGVPIIAKITRESSTGKKLNPLKFYYGNSTASKTLIATKTSNPYNFFTRLLNLKCAKGMLEYGDESDGFVYTKDKIAYKKSSNRIVNEYTAGDTLGLLSGLGNTYCTTYNNLFTEPGFVDMFCMDADDIPGDEIVVVKNIVENNKDKVVFNVYYTKEKRDVNNKIIKTKRDALPKYTRPFEFNTLLADGSVKFVNPKHYFQGDFTGNGRMEVLAITSNNTLGKGNVGMCYLLNLKDSAILYQGTPFQYNLDFPVNEGDITGADERSDRIYIIDYDGDGKSDICLINSTGIHLYTFEKQSSSFTCKFISSSTTVKRSTLQGNAARMLFVGEFNGDGLTDFILSPQKNLSSNTWTKYLSKGDGQWDVSNSMFLSAYPEKENLHSPVFQDLNGDGLSDLALLTNEGGNAKVKVYLMNSSPDNPNPVSTMELAFPNSIRLVPNTIKYQNYNSSLLGIGAGNSITRFHISNNDYDSRLMSGVISSSAVLSRYYYRRLNDNDTALYVPGSGARFPYYNYRGGLMVCGRRVDYMNNNTIGDNRYKYTNAIGHRQGLGLIGFNKFEYRDVMSSEYSITTFMDSLHFSLPLSNESKYAVQTNKYSVTVASNRISKVLLTQTTSDDKLKQYTTTVSYRHNAYGNITDEQMYYRLQNYDDYSYNPDNYWMRRVNTYSNIINDSIYILGLPLISTTTTSRSATPDVKRTEFTYNIWGMPLTETYSAMPASAASIIQRPLLAPAMRGVITTPDGSGQKISKILIRRPEKSDSFKESLSEITDNQQSFDSSIQPAAAPTPITYIISKITYTYNNQKKLQKKSFKPYSSTYTQDESYTYNGDGSLAAKTGVLGLVTGYEYDRVGKLMKTIDHKNNVTQYEYDRWGRNIRIKYPSGTNSDVRYKYEYVTDPSLPGALVLYTETKDNKQKSQVYRDALGRELRTSIDRPDGYPLLSDTEYDIRGRVIKESDPSKPTFQKRWKQYTYDNYNRLTRIDYPSGKFDIINHSEFLTEYIADSVITIKEFTPMGDVSTVDNWYASNDEDYGYVNYTYKSDGQIAASVANLNGLRTHFEYDQYGRRTRMYNNYSNENRTWRYNSSGQVEFEVDPDWREKLFSYDRYGRVTGVGYYGNFGVSYTYNSDGLLASENGDTKKVYTYDNLGRIVYMKEAGLDNMSFKRRYNYNTVTGYSTSVIDSVNNEQIVVKENVYDVNGFLCEVKINGTTSIWRRKVEDAYGRMVEEGIGTLTSYRGYDTDGHVTSISARRNMGSGTYVHRFTYEYSLKSGKLTRRNDLGNYRSEDFTYDGGGRLKSFDGKQVIYDKYSNITSMDGVGTYTYGGYAVASVNPTGNRFPSNTQEIVYGSNDRPIEISDYPYNAKFAYKSDNQRARMQIKQGNTAQLTRYYLGDCYEKDITPTGTNERIYLDGDAYDASSVLMRSGTGDWELLHIFRDHLGSITNITDAYGIDLQETAYDPWGNISHSWTHPYYVRGSEPSLILGRGFTGHEHLPQFGLINMNARLYDPILGRFLSPDPYVQSPGTAQNLNKYSYCLNNPLMYTDENGEFFHLIIGAVLGGIVNWATHGFKFNAKGLGYFGVGALSGALGAGVGAGISSMLPVSGLASGGFSAGFLGTSAATTATSSFISGSLTGFGGGFAGGFTTGMGNGMVEGMGFGKAFMQGVNYGVVGGLSGGVLGGIAGGIDALVSGRRFWDGATVSKKTLAKSNINIVGQDGKEDCLPASVEAVDESFGGTIEQGDVRGIKGVDPVEGTKMLYDNNVWKSYTDARKLGFDFERKLPLSPEELANVTSKMQGGARVFINLNISKEAGHGVVMKKIVEKTVTKINAISVKKIIYTIMDPAGGGSYRRISGDEIINSKNIFYIFK